MDKSTVGCFFLSYRLRVFDVENIAFCSSRDMTGISDDCILRVYAWRTAEAKTATAKAICCLSPQPYLWGPSSLQTPFLFWEDVWFQSLWLESFQQMRKWSSEARKLSPVQTHKQAVEGGAEAWSPQWPRTNIQCQIIDSFQRLFCSLMLYTHGAQKNDTWVLSQIWMCSKSWVILGWFSWAARFRNRRSRVFIFLRL